MSEDRPRRTRQSMRALAQSTPTTSANGNGNSSQSSASSNPYRKPKYSTGGRGGGDRESEREIAEQTPPTSSRGRGRGRGRPPSTGSGRGRGRAKSNSRPECFIVRSETPRGGGNGPGRPRKSGVTPASSKKRRGYNSHDFHYGSDFDSDQEQGESEQEEGREVEDSDKDSNANRKGDSSDEAESDSDISLHSRILSLPSPPVPFWLDTENNIEELEIPESSDDLLLGREYVVKAASIYEPIRRFHQLVRLSPFKFEDFCAALASEEQSNLLAEVHIQLLKTILREDEKYGTVFGPTESKDSTSTTLFFMDNMTWAESLRAFMESDPNWGDILSEISSVEYPFCGPEVRIKVLSWLVDVFLMTNLVRETILSEGTILHEDHCRSCNRLGELICCETCPAVYHLVCVDPPIADDDVPDDWKCPICVKHKVSGVNDVASDLEKAGLLIRHEKLGYDRHGRKYWFIVRRIIAESDDGTEVWYYSTPLQIDELLRRLDPEKYEIELCKTINDLKDEILRHMEVTEKITNQQNTMHRKTYLEMENSCLKRMQEEREFIKLSVEEEKKRIEEAERLAKLAEEEEKNKVEEEKQRKIEEEKKRIREERLARRNKNKFMPLEDEESFDYLLNDSEYNEEEKKDGEIKQDGEIGESETGQPNAIGDVKQNIHNQDTQLVEGNSQIPMEVSGEELTVATTEEVEDTKVKAENTTESQPQVQPKPIVDSTPSALKSKALSFNIDSEVRMTRLKASGLYKLGLEGNFRSYTNVYSTDTLALSKLQHNDERDRRRLMSHKFSLTSASECKWSGSTQGYRAALVGSLRGTLINFESSIPPTLLHVNWHLMRKPWVTAVSGCVSPKDFSKAMIAFASCCRPAIFNSIWTEGIGHLKLSRVDALEKDEIKKAEKRDKKDRDEEEDRLRLLPQFVKYSIPPKHQIWKQKGEEYRFHARYGWIWISTLRPAKPMDCRKLGLLNGPHKHVIQVKNEVGKVKTMLIDPSVFDKLMAKRNNASTSKVKSIETEGVTAGSNKAGEEIEKDEKSNDGVPTPSPPSTKMEEDESNDGLKKDIVIQSTEPILKDEKLIEMNPPSAKMEIDGEGEAEVIDETSRMTTMAKNDLKPSAELPKEIFEDEEPSIPTPGPESEPAEEKESKMEVDGQSEEVKKEEEGEAAKPVEESVEKVTEKKVEAAEPPPKNEECKKFKTDLINVSLGIVSANRILYPKIAHKVPFLDGLLARRLRLYNLEEKELVTTYGTETLEKVKANVDLTATEQPISIKIDDNFPLGGIYIDYKCYSHSCNVDAIAEKKDYESLCYSPLCRLKFVITQNHTRKLERIKNAERDKYEKAKKEILAKRHYTQPESSGKVYLNKPPDFQKKKRNPVKYPPASGFKSNVSKKPSILILPQYELRKLARSSGRHFTPAGFTQNTKTSWVWPYPCGRPFFKTAWQFRTVHANTISSIALQLRILYASIKWDDIIMKPPPNSEGKNQVTTDMEIITTEILNHKIVGRFLERVQYLRKKHVVPIDAPSPKITPRVYSDNTPSRLGLRKRKRADSPEKSDPVVTEEWVDEDKVEIWEIKYYGERMERKGDPNSAKKSDSTPNTRTKAGTTLNRPDKYDPSPNPAKTAELIKEQLETEMKMQRAVHLSKRDNHAKPVNAPIIKTPTASQQLQQQNAAAGLPANPRSYSNIAIAGGKKFFITKSGSGQNVITTTVTSSPVSTAPGLTSSTNPVILNRKISSGVISKPTTSTPQQQQQSAGLNPNIQLYKTADGKLQIRGLAPGQQAYQTSDGRIHVVTPNNNKGAEQSPLNVISSISKPQPTAMASTPTTSRPPNQLTKIVPKGTSISQTANAIVQQNSIQAAAPVSGQALVQQQFIQAAPPPPPQQQQIQVIKMPDGKVQIRGLLPGQQAIIEDGKIHITQPPPQPKPYYIMPQQVQPQIQQQPISTTPKTVIRVIPETSTPNTSAVVSTTTTSKASGLPISIVSPSKAKAPTQLPKISPKLDPTTGTLSQATLGTGGIGVAQNQMRISSPAAVSNMLTQLVQSQNATVQQILDPNQLNPQEAAPDQLEHVSDQPPPDSSPVTKQHIPTTPASPGKLPGKIVAQVINSPQGPRVVVQGLNPSQLSQEQMNLLQQTIQAQIFKSTPAGLGDKGPPQIVFAPSGSPTLQKIVSSPSSPKPKSPTKPKTPSKFSPLPSIVNSIEAVASAAELANGPGILKNILQNSPEANAKLSVSNNAEGGGGGSNAILKALSEAGSPRGGVSPSPTKGRGGGGKGNPKKRMDSPQLNMKYTGQKLVSTLFKHKESLKKDIVKKRSLLEKNLQLEIQKEISDEIARSNGSMSSGQGSAKRKSIQMKRKLTDKSPSPKQPQKKKKKTEDSLDKVYCICKTPYDSTKFYVGCDKCLNWYHGSCIGITEEMSKVLSDYICDACQEADTSKVYCLCKQPYDESQFYICCDTCQDWFHGRCVGILQAEGNQMEIYYCPNCDPDSPINHANLKPLNFDDYQHLVKLLKQMQSHKCSWPFLEPVDPTEAPNYYRVIKEPMDLQTVEFRVEEKCYSRLRDFIGDITKIFENCRYYNPPESPFYKSAEALEGFFTSKIALLRQKLA